MLPFSRTPRDFVWSVAAVAIEKHEDLCAACDCCCGTSGAGATVAALRLDQHRRAGGARLGNRLVAAAPIDDEDFIDPVQRYGRHYLADCSCFVEDRDDCGSAGPLPVAHKLQRTPHDVQEGGGSLLISARRKSW
jgi:hypothetical protein